jgi:hypothetical protein
MITSVWSSYGHRFYATDSPEYECCMTCAAVYKLIETPDEPWSGRYVNNRGEQPNECTGDTGMMHGYPGERCCLDCNGSPSLCSHVEHNCDCLACDS